MPRLPHGLDVTPETAANARGAVADRVADVPLAFAMTKPVDLRRFDYLFPELQAAPDNLLPPSRETRALSWTKSCAGPADDDPRARRGVGPGRTW